MSSTTGVFMSNAPSLPFRGVELFSSFPSSSSS